MDLYPEPDLHPLYPAVAQLSGHFSSHSGLTREQKAKLAAHCLIRSCVFGDFPVLQFLLNDPQTQSHLDLCFRDEDGVGLISVTIQGFGGDVDRDIEREECVRLLASQGADMLADKGMYNVDVHSIRSLNLFQSRLDSVALCSPPSPTYPGFVLNDTWLLSFLADGKESYSP